MSRFDSPLSPQIIPSTMSALTEIIALQRTLQNYVGRLDEVITQLTSAGISRQDAPAVCRFCDDQIIAWQDRQHVFSPGTYTLLQQFFEAPDLMLFKEDIRQDVLRDDDASEGCVRQCILTARKELRRRQFPYRIETITRKGYRLVAE